MVDVTSLVEAIGNRQQGAAACCLQTFGQQAEVQRPGTRVPVQRNLRCPRCLTAAAAIVSILHGNGTPVR